MGSADCVDRLALLTGMALEAPASSGATVVEILSPKFQNCPVEWLGVSPDSVTPVFVVSDYILACKSETWVLLEIP